MPKKSKTLCVDDLRHAEYYGMQSTFDELYQKSQNGEVFENLMDLIRRGLRNMRRCYDGLFQTE